MPKTVVISGASSGIGFAIAQMLNEAGYQVIGLSRSYPKESYPFAYYLCDVTSESQVRQVVENIVAQHSQIDALVNCAGMGISGAIETTTTAQIKKIFDVNLMGTFLLTQAMIPHLRQVPNSKIINIGSVAGVLTIPFQAYYSITKAGINAYTEALRMELRPFGIRVGAILPGDTKTNFTANREKSASDDASLYGDRIAKSIGRMEQDEIHGKSPDTVAKVCLKLLNRKQIPVFTTVGFKYKLFLFVKRLVPNRLLNWILFQMYAK